MTSLAVFLGLVAIVLGGIAWFLRGTVVTLSNSAAEHAKTYSLAYAKGTGLILVAMISAFDENFRDLTADQAKAFAWWNWAIQFMKPILAGLAVFVAFIDKSATGVSANKPTTQPPFNP